MAVLGNQTDRLKNIRQLASNLSSDDVSNNALIKDIESNDVIVMTKTSKFDWIETDAKFKAVIMASDLFTSAQQLESFAGTTYLQKIKDQRAEANSIIDAINGITSDGGTGQGSSGSSKTTPQFGGPNLADELDPDFYTPKSTIKTP